MTLLNSYNFHGLRLELHGQASAAAANPGLAMNISSSFRILGGGAIIDNQPSDAGNLLWASWPISGQEWDARAKEHELASSGVLHIYCITADVPPSEYKIESNTSPTPINHPTAQATRPPGFILVGGGAKVNWQRTGGPGDLMSGGLLYASRPGAGESWFAAAKDHVRASLTTVTAYAIGVSESFLYSHGMKVVRFRANSVAEAPHPVVNCAPGDDLTLISGGAETNWRGSGSLLTASSPDIPLSGPPTGPYAWLARGKDHAFADPTTITAWALSLVKYR